jgi:uncharacterized glyoxalase superfamily protein PhnB
MKIKSLTPELLVENVQVTIEFYEKILGFKIKLSVPQEKPFFVVMIKDDIEIMLYARQNFEDEIDELKFLKTGGTFMIYFKVLDIEEFYKTIKEKAEIIQKLHDTEYGSKEFIIKDNNGYFLGFFQDV